MTDKESQKVEFKSDWKDDCLKAISAFANCMGGKLFIGLNDRGKPVSLKNINKLLEDIPNIIRNKLGIIPVVELKRKGDAEIISIKIDPSSMPISYRDLSNLVEKGIFKRVGIGKRQVHYVLNDSKKMQ